MRHPPRPRLDTTKASKGTKYARGEPRDGRARSRARSQPRSLGKRNSDRPHLSIEEMSEAQRAAFFAKEGDAKR
jgi:hypothetical protein